MKESETVDPSLKFSPVEWPYRTTLLHRGNRRYELFECGEEWSLCRRIPIRNEERVGTLLSRTPLDPGEVGKPVPGSGDAKVLGDTDEVMVDVGGIPEAPEPRRQDRGPVQPLGPLPVEAHEHEEALEVNGVKLTEESSLKPEDSVQVSPHLKERCKSLGLGKAEEGGGHVALEDQRGVL